jgi:hypothetical protein
MNKRQAKQLNNRDEVLVRTSNNTWEHGTVLGEPYEICGRVIIPTITPTDGYREIDHTDAK